ncbi:hypothetical protein SprV_0602167900 [Sparganum proliferum]
MSNGVLSFLDVQVSRQEDGTHQTGVFRKAADTEKILHYNSNHPLSHKRSCVRTLFHRIHTHCSTEAEKLRERKTLWHLFLANGYPRSFVNKCLYRRHTKTDGEKKQRLEIFRVLPYVRNVSEATERMLRPLSVGVEHRPEATIRRLIMQPKDRLPPADTSGVIYRVKCLDCPANYCGMTDKRLRTHMHEHTLAVRRKDVRSHVAMHCLENNHTFDFDGAQVLGRAESKLAREVIEAWKSDTNSINRSIDLPAPDELAQRLASLPVAAASDATDENASVENRWCQLQDTVQSTALAVLGRARRQHLDWFDDNDAVISNLLAEKNRLHKAYIDRPTEDNRAAFYRSRRLVQQRLREIQEAWTACKAEEIQGYADRNEWKNFFAAITTVYVPSTKGTAPLLSADGSTLLTEKTQILQRWAEHFRGRPSTISNVAITHLSQVEANADLDLSLLSRKPSVPCSSSPGRKAPRSDAIPAEVYKHGGPQLTDNLTENFQEMWSQG